MRFSICTAVIMVFFLLLKTGQSQIFPVQHYSTENGLATRSVYDVTQDKNGRMWFSTGVGISSYDGYSWTNYGEEQGVPKHRYSRIFCDGEGVIWAASGATSDEVIYFNNGKWERLPPIPKSITTECEISGLGIIRTNGFPGVYLSTYQGLFLYSAKGWERVRLSENPADELIYSSTSDGAKHYLAARQGVFLIENGKVDNSLNAKIPSNFGTVLKITADKITGSNPDRLWMLSKDRIGYLERDSFVTVSSGFSLSLKSVLDYFFLSVCTHGEVYFGNVWTRYTLNSQSGGSILLTEENGFAAEGNTSAFRDREDNIWFSDYKGVDKINTLAFRNHTILNGLGENDISAVIEFGPQSFAYGHNAGITIFNNFHFKYIPFENIPGYVMNGSRVLDFYKDKSGKVWFAASRLGAGIIDKEGNIKWFPPPDGVFINSINENSKGDLIFASSEGLYTLKNDRFETWECKGLGKIQIRRLFNFGGNFLWAAATSGFLRISDNEVKYIKTSGIITEKSAFSLYKDRDGTIYAGTEKGLYEIVNDSLVAFRRNGFEINDAVFAITKDTVNGFLWFGTGTNLIRWNGADNIKKFNSLNGLVKGEISRSGLFFDSRNTLWVGTDAGLSRYIPALDYDNNNIPVPEIISIDDFSGNKYSSADVISTGNGNASLKFSVRGISFVSEKLMEYRIKLDGFDKEWILINQDDVDNIVYKNLQPGNYRFRMSVRNYSGKWSDEISSGEISIKSVFYKRWWFVVLAIAVVIFNMLYFYNRYMKRKYTRYLENKVRLRTSELEISQSELRLTLASLEEKVEERTRELAESENKLRSIIEQASDGIAIYEIESRKLILVNPAYADMLGFTEKEMLNMTIYDIVAHDKDSIDHYIENVIADDTILIKERHHRRKDGSLLPVEVSVNMIFYHDIEAICVLVRDITERRNMQHALYESEKKFREIVELLPEAVFETDVYGNITFVNRQGLDLFGYSEDDNVIGRSIIETIAPEEKERAVSTMMEVVNGKIHAGTNFTGIKKDGTRIPFYINKAPIIDGGKCVGIRGIAVDMTRYVHTEERLKAYTEELKEVNATKDKFFSIIAHDLRAPFTGFLGFTELLHQEVENMSKEEIARFAGILRNSARNNYELLENLLQWGRLQTGSLEIKNERIEITKCVSNVLKLLQYNFENKQITVVNNFNTPVYAKGDCNIVQSVLQNLLSNSIKFTNRNGNISIDCGQNDGSIYISVKDNGIGISRQVLEKLFRLDSHITTQGTEKETGTGLGLLVCREMVEKMNGKIEIESKVNEGTTVTFSLHKDE